MSKAPEAVTLEIGGAQLTVPKDDLFRAWFSKHLDVPQGIAVTVTVTGLARLALKDGEHYAGVLLGKDGAPGQHLILLPGEAESVTWQGAKDWAAEAGGELPTRREQSLLFANVKEQFNAAWYWSCEQHVSYSAFAWFQDFCHGYQDHDRKGHQFRARAVRRLVIE